MPRARKKKRVEDPMILRVAELRMDGLKPIPQEEPPVPELLQVPQAEVEMARETVIAWLYGVESWSRGAIDLDSMLDLCKEESSQLWLGVVDGKAVGALVTEIRTYPLARVICIWCLGGDVRAMLKAHGALDEFARREGATRIQVECPKWGEKIIHQGELGRDMKPVRAILERDLYTEIG